VKSKHAEGDIKQNKCVKKLNLENIVEKLEIYAPKGGIWQICHSTRLVFDNKIVFLVKHHGKYEQLNIFISIWVERDKH